MLYLFISRFGFKSGIRLLIAPVPVHCFSITFLIYVFLFSGAGNCLRMGNIQRAHKSRHSKPLICSIFRYVEPFEIGKHPQGTEVKAITYSNMQIHDNDDQHEVFVIIDI